MPRRQKRRCRRCRVAKEDLEARRATRSLMSVQVSIEQEDSSLSYSSFSSFFSSSASSYNPLLSITTEEESVVAGKPSPSQYHRAYSSPTTMVSTPCSFTDQGYHELDEWGPSTPQALPSVTFFPTREINVKVKQLVKFLLLKYRMKEHVTRAEMLTSVIRNFRNYYHVIFTEASRDMLVVFGIDVKQVNSCGNLYILVPALELTYDGMLSEVQGVPKTGLLIIVLCIIFTEGSPTSEVIVWRGLNNIGVCAESNHFIYGCPRKLITEEFVQEGYLEIRQVPHSDPAHYEFLWGPRALVETSKMKLLQFLTEINGIDHRLYPLLYEDALRDEEERAQATTVPSDNTPAMHHASFSAPAASNKDEIRQ